MSGRPVRISAITMLILLASVQLSQAEYRMANAYIRSERSEQEFSYVTQFLIVDSATLKTVTCSARIYLTAKPPYGLAPGEDKQKRIDCAVTDFNKESGSAPPASAPWTIGGMSDLQQSKDIPHPNVFWAMDMRASILAYCAHHPLEEQGKPRQLYCVYKNLNDVQ